jgi:hypothetical protein
MTAGKFYQEFPVDNREYTGETEQTFGPFSLVSLPAAGIIYSVRNT